MTLVVSRTIQVQNPGVRGAIIDRHHEQPIEFQGVNHGGLCRLAASHSVDGQYRNPGFRRTHVRTSTVAVVL
jgi:hypothetical protein